MYKAVVSAKGQIVIPSALRKKFGAKKGAQVCVYERGGEIIIKPITDKYIQSMAGIARTKGRLFRAHAGEGKRTRGVWVSIEVGLRRRTIACADQDCLD